MSANPRYSLRAFARDLDILPQQLSLFFNGKKGLSTEAAAAIADKLNFSKSEKAFFHDLIQSKYARSKSVRKIAESKIATSQKSDQRSQNLSIDAFKVISDWYHFALVELLKIPTSKSLNEKLLAKRFGLSTFEIEAALARLLRLGLISKKGKSWQVENDTILTTDGVPSEALRKFHKQVLEKALVSISTQSVQERYLSTSLLSVCKEDFEEASKLIANFRMKFTERMTSKPGQEVYALGIQYFKLTENKEEK